MVDSVFFELRFWLLIVFSFVVPVLIYATLIRRRTIVRSAVIVLGLCLVAIAGIDVYLLQVLETMARQSKSLVDDAVFASEISLALYVLPIFFGGVGVNVVSHVLIAHLLEAEKQFDLEHPKHVASGGPVVGQRGAVDVERTG